MKTNLLLMSLKMSLKYSLKIIQMKSKIVKNFIRLKVKIYSWNLSIKNL